MALVGVMTTAGRNLLLKLGFYGGSGNQFRYMGVGKSSTVPTKASTALGQECSSTDGSYARVQINATFDTANERVSMDGTFDTTNITVSTTLKEVAIFDQQTLGGGTAWCICQIGDTIKDNTRIVKITITSAFTDVT